MIKKETFELLTEIKSFWDRFEVTQERIDKWHGILKDYDFQIITANLSDHVKTSKFPPTIADLIKAPEKRTGPSIPSKNDTMALFEKMEQWEREAKG